MRRVLISKNDHSGSMYNNVQKSTNIDILERLVVPDLHHRQQKPRWIHSVWRRLRASPPLFVQCCRRRTDRGSTDEYLGM